MSIESRGEGFFPGQELSGEREPVSPEQPEIGSKDEEEKETEIKTLSAEEEARIIGIIFKKDVEEMSERLRNPDLTAGERRQFENVLRSVRAGLRPESVLHEAGGSTEKKIEELRDPEGKTVCKMTVEWETEDVEFRPGLSPEALRGKRIRTIFFESVGENSSAPVDLRELTGLKDTEIIVTSDSYRGRPVVGFHDRMNDTVFMRSPETAVGMGALFHELGHGAQMWEDRYRQLVMLSGFRMGMTAYDPEDLRFAVGAVARLMPEAVGESSTALRDVDHYVKLSERLAEASSKKKEAKRRIEAARRAVKTQGRDEFDVRTDALELKDAEADLKYYEAEERDVDEDRDELLRMRTPGGIWQLLQMPLRTLERDATRRALQWMRKLRKETGVDLIGARVGDEIKGIGFPGADKDGEENSCEDLSVKDFLIGALETTSAGQSAARQTKKADKPKNEERKQDVSGVKG